MKLNREQQKEILRTLEKKYPQAATSEELLARSNYSAGILANAVYLKEHGLIEAHISEHLTGQQHLRAARITAKGLDFLADDGGLTAILEVVTVRLEADTIRSLMAKKVESSELPTHEKNRLLEGLKDLPNEAMKQLTQQIVNEGVERAPGILQWLGTLIGQ